MGKKKRGRESRKTARKRRSSIWAGLIIFIVAGILAWGWFGSRGPKKGRLGELNSSGYVRREARVPLSSALFVGQTARAYQVAHEIPDVLDQLYCYCECDKHMGHKSLLSCFADSHGATWVNICQGEALDASRMVQQGYSMEEIRSYIDRKYSRM